MNKKELSLLKKGFKIDSNLRISKIIQSYCKMGQSSSSILFSQNSYFDELDQDTIGLLLGNFKKMLSGAVGSKLFEFEFDIENETGLNKQKFFFDTLNNDQEFEERALEISNMILENYASPTDIVITVAKANYYMQTETSSKHASDDIEDEENVTTFDFILCTINSAEIPEKTLAYNYKNKTLELTSGTPIINFKTPSEGFMFPTIVDGFSDCNQLIYFTSQSNAINLSIVNNTLNCVSKLTEKEEKNLFSEILKATIGDKISANVMADIFDEISKTAIKNNNTATINTMDLQEVFKKAEIKNYDQIESVVDKYTGKECVDIMINSILAVGKKSVKLNSANLDISLNPAILKNVKQINKNGTKCLIIELNDTINLQGFELAIQK